MLDIIESAGEIEVDMLLRRLADTEAAMERIVVQMGNFSRTIAPSPDNVNTQVLTNDTYQDINLIIYYVYYLLTNICKLFFRFFFFLLFRFFFVLVFLHALRNVFFIINCFYLIKISFASMIIEWMIKIFCFI